MKNKKLNVKNVIKHAYEQQKMKKNIDTNGTLSRIIIHPTAEGLENTACRFSGTFTVNKITGMLHITALGHGYMGKHTDHKGIP
jgi:hypothetical protein